MSVTDEARLFSGRAAGGCRAAGAREDRTAAPSRLGLFTHRHGFLQDERGRLLRVGAGQFQTDGPVV